jgi:uncharacterized protein YjbI with pentapeptide repeats
MNKAVSAMREGETAEAKADVESKDTESPKTNLSVAKSQRANLGDTKLADDDSGGTKSNGDNPSERLDWSYQSKTGQDLRGIDLSGANLRRTIFDGADLEGANLSGADCRNASFSRANMMKVALDGADLRGARFIKAKLSLANLQDARFDDADLRGLRGRYATWRRANWWDARLDESLANALAKKWPRPPESQ